MRYFFRKNQRLHKDYDISPLFREGEGLFNYPVKLIYRLIPAPPDDGTPCRVVIVVAKRHLKKAFMRNLVRRRLREAYRLNINNVLPPSGQQLHIAILYVAHEVVDYAHVERSLAKLMHSLNAKVAIKNEQQQNKV